jgi:hypothetical protein
MKGIWEEDRQKKPVVHTGFVPGLFLKSLFGGSRPQRSPAKIQEKGLRVR